MSEDSITTPEDAKAKADRLMQENLNCQAKYPAMFLVDWPGNPVYACNDHAAKLVTLARAIGHNIVLQGCGPGHACSNCINEAEKKGEEK